MGAWQASSGQVVLFLRSYPLLVKVDEFDHIDPKGVSDINELGEIKPALARFVVENERLRFAKSGGKLFCCQAFGLPERDENSCEGVDAALMMGKEVHALRSPCRKIAPSPRLLCLATRTNYVT